MRMSQAILTATPSAPAMITTAALAAATGIDRHDVVNVVDRLSKRGLVTKAKLGKYQRTAAGDRVIAEGRVIRPGPSRPGIDAGGKPQERAIRGDRADGGNTLVTRAWRALRHQRKATIPELLEIAATGNEKWPAGQVGKYLKILSEHGIVAAITRRKDGIAPTTNGFKQWVLLKDLGPKPPMWRASKRQLVDRNTGEVIAREEASA